MTGGGRYPPPGVTPLEDREGEGGSPLRGGRRRRPLRRSDALMRRRWYWLKEPYKPILLVLCALLDRSF